MDKRTTDEDLEQSFGFHPATDDTAPKHARVREECLYLAIWLNAQLPEGRQKSLTFTALEEVMYRANAAIAMDAPLSNTPQVANPQRSQL